MSIDSPAGHYIPRFYLKGFLDPDKRLWILERGSAPRKSTPKAAANKPDFYRLDQTLQDCDFVEKALAEAESRIAPTVRKIGNPQFQVSPAQLEDLVMFTAITFARVPAFMDFVNEGTAKMAKDFIQKQAADHSAFGNAWKDFTTKHKTHTTKEAARKYILQGDYRIVQKNKDLAISLMFGAAQRVAQLLGTEYNAELWYAPKDETFFTSDNPVVTISPRQEKTVLVGMGFANPSTEVVFPLNKKCCLHLSRTIAWNRQVVSSKLCKQINHLVMANAIQYAFGPSGTKKWGRIFDQHGCRIKYGENAFISRKQTGNE